MEASMTAPASPTRASAALAAPPASPTAVSPPASPTRGEFVYKVILIGSPAVGKTNLLAVAARGQQFNERSPPTMQPEFVTVKVPRPDWKFGEPNQFLRAQVWDTAGQERYQAISSAHYRRANGALIVYDVSTRSSLKEVYPGVPGGNRWLHALRENGDKDLLAAVMLVENKIDKLDAKAADRPATFVQDADVKRLLAECVFNDPPQGLGWLHDAAAHETVPFRIANSLMYARTSARSGECALYELTEKHAAFGAGATDLFKQTATPSAEYEQTHNVETIAQALDALVLRIYARSKDMHAGGSKVSGAAFKVHATTAGKTTSTAQGSCC